jgi:sugar lactone lactonase YvrE
MNRSLRSLSARVVRSALLGAGLLGLCATACTEQPVDDSPKPCVNVGDICTFAGSGTSGFSGDDGPALKADFYSPMDVVFGPDQNLYVVDWNNHRIRQVTPDGKTVRTVAGKGELGDETADGIEQDTSFNHPTSALFDGQGRLLIAAWHNSRIKRLDLTTGKIENLCGIGKRAYIGDDGPADKAALDLPTSLALDADGNLFVMDQANQVIRKIDAAKNVTRVAGRCIIGTCADGELPAACPGTNKLACGLATSPGACSEPCGIGYGGDGGPALDARFGMPFGQAADPGGRLAFDPQGNLFLADTRNARIRRIAKDGSITTVAGTGIPGYAGDGGPATAAKLNKPIDVEVGPDGAVYFTDTGNSCVRAVGTDGTIRTVAGICGQRGVTGDGAPATKGLLDHPYGLTFDRNGNLFIADTENSKIREVKLK